MTSIHIEVDLLSQAVLYTIASVCTLTNSSSFPLVSMSAQLHLRYLYNACFKVHCAFICVVACLMWGSCSSAEYFDTYNVFPRNNCLLCRIIASFITYGFTF